MNRFIFISIVFIATAQSQWSTDPNNNLIVGYGLLPEMCGDSVGGAYVTYEVNSVYPRYIALHWLNRYGYQPWGSSRQIRGVKPEVRYASIASDGKGGALIAYLDREWDLNPENVWYNDRVRVQRVDSSGNLLWGQYGIRASLAEHTQSENRAPTIISDGEGGCVAGWLDTLGTIRLQRLNNLGDRLWGDSGIVGASSLSTPKIIRSGRTHFFLSYARLLKRFSLAGVPVWNDTSVNVGLAVSNVIEDGIAGLVVSGKEGTAQNILIVAQRIDSSGSKLWSTSYVVLAESAGVNGAGIPISACGDSSFLIAWIKGQTGTNQLFSQRLSSLGAPTWGPNGILVSAITSNKSSPLIIPSNRSGGIFFWRDDRPELGNYSQRIDSGGNRAWDSLDVVVSHPTMSFEKAVVDCNGGAILMGFRQDDFSVRLQQISSSGVLGQIITTGKEGAAVETPSGFFLHQNYPNPFNPTTSIIFHLHRQLHVTLVVYDILGRLVFVVLDAIVGAGEHTASFDATQLVSGVYFLRLITSQSIQTRKMVLQK